MKVLVSKVIVEVNMIRGAKIGNGRYIQGMLRYVIYYKQGIRTGICKILDE